MNRRLAITPGEPAGIGPDITIKIAQNACNYQRIAIADPNLLTARAEQLKLPLKLIPIDYQAPPQGCRAGELFLEAIKLKTPCTPGKLDKTNAAYVINTLERAVERAQQHQIQALITGPVQKSIIIDSGIAFSGHTEFLAEKTQTPMVVMMLATQATSPALRVALATTHLPLAKVSEAITKERLRSVLRILNNDLKNHFGIKQPKILVCGLNPHAGEGGHLGLEEITTISPVINELKAEMQLDGPLPADTAFTAKYLQNADAILAMYHDQGLPVLKSHSFGEAVNITLGLPFIRTSVDHGTALDLAGTGLADSKSLACALDYADHLTRQSA